MIHRLPNRPGLTGHRNTATDILKGADTMPKLTATPSQILDINSRIGKLHLCGDILDDHDTAVELALLMDRAIEKGWDRRTIAAVAYALGQQRAQNEAADATGQPKTILNV